MLATYPLFHPLTHLFLALPAVHSLMCRMAQLLVEVRRADAAVPVLEELISLCSSSNGAAAAAPVDAATLRGYRSRLGQAQSAARRQTMPHHYRLLGVTEAAAEDDVRK